MSQPPLLRPAAAALILLLTSAAVQAAAPVYIFRQVATGLVPLPVAEPVVPAAPAASCTLPWGGTLASGGAMTGYSAATVPYGQDCSSVARTVACDNGALSANGSTAGACSVLPDPSLSNGTSRMGGCQDGSATGCATFDAAANSGTTLSADKLTTTSTTNHSHVRMTTCKSSGKWYWELTETQNGNFVHSGYGLLPQTSASGSNGSPARTKGGWALEGNLNGVYGTDANGVASPVYPMTPLNPPETLGIAMDLDNRQATFIQADSSNVTVPLLPSGAYCGELGYMHGAVSTLNAGQATFVYAVPAGFHRGLW